MMGGWAMGWTWLWPALIVIGLVIIGWVVGRLAQSGRDSSTASADGSAAHRILDERYARGEIDDEEYRKRKAALS
jgi:putative membrane protein